jgi:colanic acid/amylovoran biosynthesis protein
MKRISVIGATISGNRGAEAMLSTVVGRILEKEPGAVFNVYSYYPEEDRKLCQGQNVRIFSATPVSLVFYLFPLCFILGFLKLIRMGGLRSLFPKGVRALEESDALIDISGVSFMDGRAIFIPFNILNIFPAMLVGTPVVKFAQALGPFKNPLVNISSRIFLSRCTRIFARGAATRKNLEDMKLHKDILDSAADLAFLHRESYSLSQENPEYLDSLISRIETLKKNDNTIIGLCPSSVIASKARKEKWNYVQMLSDIVKRLSEQGYTVLLFPNATREKSGKLRNNDLPVIEKIARYLAAFNEYPDDLLVVAKDINTVGIKRLMSYCDLNIVSRFHAMIASIALGKPLVVMGWGHKYQEVMQQFGLEDYVFDYKNNKPELLLDKVGSAFNQRNFIEKNIKQQLPEAQKQSHRQFDFLFDMFDKDLCEKI